MEPLSEAALGVLRDKTIADYLLEHFCGTTVFPKQDHGQKLLDHITQQFKLAGLPVPQTYMKSVDNVYGNWSKSRPRRTRPSSSGSLRPMPILSASSASAKRNTKPR